MRHRPNLPLARKTDLVTRALPDELLVYDLKQHKAFCLNETAAAVWKSCNGKRTVADLAERLQRTHDFKIDPRVIRLALDQLDQANLMMARERRPSPHRINRRGLIRGGVIAATVPLVTMIVAPTPQAAATMITSADCASRTQTMSGGCGGLKCSDVSGSCKNDVGITCKCK